MEAIELTIDVTEAADLGEDAAVALTVHLPAPEALGSPPVVCFAKPGAGFSRAYFTENLRGPGRGIDTWASWVVACSRTVNHQGASDAP